MRIAGSSGDPRVAAKTRTRTRSPFFTDRRKASVSSDWSMMPLTAAGSFSTRVSAADSDSNTLGKPLDRSSKGIGASPKYGNVPVSAGIATVSS